MKILPAPDFPTGGIILGQSGSRQAYLTGKGSIIIRAKHIVEEQKDRFSLVITEIPYQVNKSSLVEKIAELAREKKSKEYLMFKMNLIGSELELLLT